MKVTYCAQCGQRFKGRREWRWVTTISSRGRAVTLPMCRDDRRCWVCKQVQSAMAVRCRKHAQRFAV